MPDFRHVFTLTDGETIVVPHRQAQKVIDKRTGQTPPEICFEITLDSGLVRRVWMTEIREWRQEAL